MVILGIDYGKKYIGLATARTESTIATPLTTIQVMNDCSFWLKLDNITKEWNPTAFVVGVPYRESGVHSAMTKSALNFTKKLALETQKPVHTINEALSSQEAHNRFIEQRKLKLLKKKDASFIHAISAQIILETWLHNADYSTQ